MVFFRTKSEHLNLFKRNLNSKEANLKSTDYYCHVQKHLLRELRDFLMFNDNFNIMTTFLHTV